MTDLEPQFETLETRLMRAWMRRDIREVKALVEGDAIFMFGIAPPVLLDRTSFVGAIESGFRCEGYRFHELTARKYGRCVWFSGHVELEMRLGMQEWRGKFLVTDLWRKGRINRKWKLAERSLSPIEEDAKLSDAIRSFQLWR